MPAHYQTFQLEPPPSTTDLFEKPAQISRYLEMLQQTFPDQALFQMIDYSRYPQMHLKALTQMETEKNTGGWTASIA